MAKVSVRKKIEVDLEQDGKLAEVKHYARRIWLAGLGVYTRVNEEGSEYVKELIRAGERAEKEAKKAIDEKVEAANSEFDSIKGEAGEVKNRFEAQLDRIEGLFDRRIAKGLHRIGIPSRHDVEALSAKLDELTALLERVGNRKLERPEPKKLERVESDQ
ncbi:phasin family protein [Pseudomonas syringae]|nr:phasin family protein [Pseudomonas syringae]MBD8788499.1 phasin family protein [Pseudomonas syringae]MBD8799301.1 phasin family protein [Pseudomonas syringae]MBD8811498.1 phasin family protein [Pseudomonas syringae]